MRYVVVLRSKGTDGETVAKVCQALVQTRSSKRVGEARALSCPLAARTYRDDG